MVLSKQDAEKKYEEIKQKQKKLQEKLQKEREEREKKELESCTFAPKTNIKGKNSYVAESKYLQ